MLYKERTPAEQVIKGKRSIPYSQALRLKRICSTPASFENRAKELTHFLVARGYHYKSVCNQIQKVRGMDREILIKGNARPPRDRIPFTVTYHPRLPNIGGFLKELHPLLQLSNRCNQAVPHVPMMAFRRPKNLQDYLVRAKLRPPSNSDRGTKGTTVKVTDAMFATMLFPVVVSRATQPREAIT